MLSSNKKRPADNLRHVSLAEVALPVCTSEAFHKDGSPLSVRVWPRSCAVPTCERTSAIDDSLSKTGLLATSDNPVIRSIFQTKWSGVATKIHVMRDLCTSP